MLRNEAYVYQTGRIVVMSELAVIAASAKTTLRDIAKQASGLATGLQNAAPGEKADKPNKSVQYLFEIADQLAKLAEECDNLR